MAQFIVTRASRELSRDGSHRHIAGVCTNTNSSYTRRQVVESIAAGNTWYSLADGKYAVIKPIRVCPRPACVAEPYITTAPDSTTANNLENLPEC